MANGTDSPQKPEARQELGKRQPLRQLREAQLEIGVVILGLGNGVESVGCGERFSGGGGGGRRER